MPKKESQPTDVRHQQLEETTTELSPLDNRIAGTIGDTALSGIIEDGDTDAQAGPSNIQIEGTRNKLEFYVCKHFI